MPIKPENRARYPRNWPTISGEIRERAGHRCEWPGCRACQYAVGRWTQPDGVLWVWQPTCGNGPCDAAGQGLSWPDLQRWTYAEARQFAAELDWAGGEGGCKPVVIVLTVAHLDHQPENCSPGNLRAWCQRHHLAYDANHHRHTAYMGRRQRNPNLELFSYEAS